MYYICNRCHNIVTELPTFAERHPYGDGYAEERALDPSCMCGGEYEAARVCDMCGEIKSESDNYFYEGICDDCLKEKAGNLDLVVKCVKNEPTKETVKVDAFLTYMLHPETITTFEMIMSLFVSLHISEKICDFVFETQEETRKEGAEE